MNSKQKVMLIVGIVLAAVLYYASKGQSGNSNTDLPAGDLPTGDHTDEQQPIADTRDEMKAFLQQKGIWDPRHEQLTTDELKDLYNWVTNWVLIGKPLSAPADLLERLNKMNLKYGFNKA